MADNKCPFGCSTCSRRCTAAAPLSHRFDCCGTIHAHDVAVRRGARGKVETSWRRITDPMRAGYLTGPSKTRAPA